MSMSLAGAEHAGLVKRDAAGNYSEVSAAEQAAANTPPPENVEQPEAFTAEADEAALANLAANVRPEAVQDIVTAFVSGRPLTPANLHDYGRQAGMSPEQFETALGGVMASFTQQANETVKKTGLADSDLGDFYNYCEANHAEAFKTAKLDHALRRSTRGYVALADRYMRSVAPSENVLRAAGYTLGKAGDGSTTVLINGAYVSLKVAAKTGLI
jgi:hypothetical protein